MPLGVGKAIFQTNGGLKVGRAALGTHGSLRGTVSQETHDGDTVAVDADGDLGVRFLGVDAPEVSLPLPGGPRFVPITDARWAELLDHPFARTVPKFDPPLSAGLRAHLAARCTPDEAGTHARLAALAERALEREIGDDIERLGQDTASFRFFFAFAHEVMDGSGRLLAYVNRDQPLATDPEPRPKSYNERLLASGAVTPYFIWPNVDPYRRQSSLVDAVPAPGGVTPHGQPERAARSLEEARRVVKEAREGGLGVYEPAAPLGLYPFELRFISRRRPPDRFVIDLSAGDDRLMSPDHYYRIPHPEDRLFVPAEYVPLFEARGWRRNGA